MSVSPDCGRVGFVSLHHLLRTPPDRTSFPRHWQSLTLSDTYRTSVRGVVSRKLPNEVPWLTLDDPIRSTYLHVKTGRGTGEGEGDLSSHRSLLSHRHPSGTETVNHPTGTPLLKGRDSGTQGPRGRTQPSRDIPGSQKVQRQWRESPED